MPKDMYMRSRRRLLACERDLCDEIDALHREQRERARECARERVRPDTAAVVVVVVVVASRHYKSSRSLPSTSFFCLVVVVVASQHYKSSRSLPSTSFFCLNPSVRIQHLLDSADFGGHRLTYLEKTSVLVGWQNPRWSAG